MEKEEVVRERMEELKEMLSQAIDVPALKIALKARIAELELVLEIREVGET